MEAFLGLSGLMGLSELVKIIAERFGCINPRLKIIKEKDIKEPTSEFVVNVYNEYLRCLGIDAGGSVDQKMKFAHPEAYLDTLPLVNMYSALSMIFVKHNADDFSISDLVDPTFKRTYAGILMIENYVAFCQSAMFDIIPKIETIQQRRDEYLEMVEKKNQLIAELNKKAAARSLRAGNKANLMESMAAKKDHINELSPILNDKVAKRVVLEGKFFQEKEKERVLKENLRQLEQELAVQKELVVADPEQIEREYELKKQALAKVEQEVAEASELLKKSQKEIQVFEQMMEILPRFEKYVATTRNLKKLVDKKDAMLLSKKSSLETHGIDNKSLRDDHRKRTAAVNRLKENLASEKAKAESRRAEMEKSVLQLQKERAKLEEKMDADSEQSKKLGALIEEQQKQAKHWIATKEQSEEYVMKIKSALDEQITQTMSETMKKCIANRDTAEALVAKLTNEANDVQERLAGQRVKDDAEGRVYKSRRNP